MEPNARDIIFAIRKIAGVDGLKQSSFITAIVDEVQEADRTISCTIMMGETETKLTDVLLQTEPNDGFILFPKVGTEVLICLMPDNSAYVILCNDIDKIICVIDGDNSYVFDINGFVFNGGTQGLMKIVEYTAKQNAMITALNTQLAAISTAIGLLGGTYTVVPLSAFNKTDYEDTKIKH